MYFHSRYDKNGRTLVWIMHQGLEKLGTDSVSIKTLSSKVNVKEIILGNLHHLRI